jgi:hypothetical protein
MTSRDFCYWLQGYFEIAEPKEITGEQLKTVQRHLAMVFAHEIDPSMGDKKHQDLLDLIHAGINDNPVAHRPVSDTVKLRC